MGIQNWSEGAVLVDLGISGDIWGHHTQFKTEIGVAVGTALASGPPHRSVREALPHTALTSGS
jgi:hypothetical protein